MDNAGINVFIDSAEHREAQQAVVPKKAHKESITRRDDYGVVLVGLSQRCGVDGISRRE